MVIAFVFRNCLKKKAENQTVDTKKCTNISKKNKIKWARILTWHCVVDTGPVLTTVSLQPYPDRPVGRNHDISISSVHLRCDAKFLMCCIDQSLGVRVISWQQFPFEKFSLIGTNKATTWLSLGSHQTCHSTVTLTATFTTVPYALTAGRNTPPRPNIYLLNWAIWTHACNEKMGLLQICT